MKASNPDASDGFGGAVALSGNTLVVSAPGESSGAAGVDGDSLDNGSRNAGAVYVFVLQNNVWFQEAYLKASNTDAFDSFGDSVGISGDTIVVGASREDSAAVGIGGDQSNNSASDVGAAYVFERTAGSWAQTAYLKASNAQAGNRFGACASITGNLIAVGAPDESGESTGINGSQAQGPGFKSGAVYLFRKSAGVWAQEAYLKAANPDAGDNFGFNVDIWDETIAVGAWAEGSSSTGVGGNSSNNLRPNSGAAYVFVLNNGSCSLRPIQCTGSPNWTVSRGAGLAITDAWGRSG